MRKLGGESTCAHLAETFGNTAGFYNALGTGFAGKIKKHFHCPDCIDPEDNDEEHSRVYVVPFIGRYIMENGNKRYSWRLREELKEALMYIDLPDSDQESVTDVGLNTILYGPPGTGKTYHTVIYAVAIIENKALSAVEKEDYAEVLERYNEYKAQGRIEFTTFHQSYGYEEFIEGIRPMITPDDTDGESGEIQYSVQPGVFKRFCERAERPAVRVDTDYGISDSPSIWKVSLEGTGDNPTRTECLKNNHIRIGWDDYGKDITDETDFSVSGGRVVLNAFINRMQVGDIVLSCYSASTIDAIGVVTGEYEWHDEYASLKRLRKVNWIVKDIRENILWSRVFLMGKSFTSFAGSEVAMALLFPMETLFESYIAALLKKKLGYADFAVSVQDKTYHLFDEPGKKFLMRPDIVVKRKADGAVFILDTKWKILADSKTNYGISQADMYQMYAYQKKYGANHVTLVYPKTDKVTYETGMEYRSDDGVTVRIRFVDLFDVQKSTQQLCADFF